MDIYGSELGLKVYLDGIPIPVESASMSFTEGQPASALLSVVPAESFFDIKPRAMVQIFYLTSLTAGHNKLAQTYDFNDTNSGTDYSEHKIDKRYKLMFSGEYIAYEFAKGVDNRTIKVHCQGPTNIFTKIQQHSYRYKAGGMEMIENKFLGTQQDKSKLTFAGKDMSDNLTKWLLTAKHYEWGEDRPKEYDSNPKTEKSKNKSNESNPKWKPTKASRNLITGLHRLIQNSMCTTNIWYAKHLTRHRLPDIIVGLRGDVSADRLFDTKVFKKFLRKRLSKGRSMVSLATLLNHFNSVILYNRVTIPSPKFISGNSGWKAKPYNDWNAWKNDGESGGVGYMSNGCLREHQRHSALNYVLFKPDFWFFTPPACNLIYPDQLKSIAYTRNFIEEPTRGLMRSSLLAKTGGRKRKTKTVYSAHSKGGAKGQQITQKGRSRRIQYLSERTYSPDVKALAGLADKKTGWRGSYHEVILPHERYAGITPLFSREGMFGTFGTKKSRKAYLRFYVDYLYWKTFYSTRNGQASLVFSPHLVPGFSCVLMGDMTTPKDKGGIKVHITPPPSPSDMEEAAFLAFDGNTFTPSLDHVCAFITSVTHTINQAGAETSISLTACRNFADSVDYDGITEIDAPGSSYVNSEREILFKMRAKLKPFEDTVVRPARDYFDSRYHSENIGRDFYYPLLGCGSIIELNDAQKFASGERANTTEDGALTLNSAILSLDYNYQRYFVGGFSASLSTQRKMHKPTYIDRMTRRQGLAGESDIIGQDNFTYGLFYISSSSGVRTHLTSTKNSKIAHSIAESTKGSVYTLDPAQQKFLTDRGLKLEPFFKGDLEMSAGMESVNNHKAFLERVKSGITTASNNVGFYEASVNPVVVSEDQITANINISNNSAASAIKETAPLRGLVAKSTGTESTDADPHYFVVERKVVGYSRNRKSSSKVKYQLHKYYRKGGEGENIGKAAVAAMNSEISINTSEVQQQVEATLGPEGADIAKDIGDVGTLVVVDDAGVVTQGDFNFGVDESLENADDVGLMVEVGDTKRHWSQYFKRTKGSRKNKKIPIYKTSLTPKCYFLKEEITIRRAMVAAYIKSISVRGLIG